MGKGKTDTPKEFPVTKQICKACCDIQEWFIPTGLWKSIPRYHRDILSGITTGERVCTYRTYAYQSKIKNVPVAGRIVNRAVGGCFLWTKILEILQKPDWR